MKALAMVLMGVLVSAAAFAQTSYPEYLLLDADGMSCRQQIQDPTGYADVDAVKMLLGTLDLKWDGDHEFRLDYIKIQLMSNEVDNGRFAKIISGLDLSYMFLGKPGVVKVAPHSMVSTTDACFVEVGGIGLTDTNIPAAGNGEILFVGTYNDGTSTRSAVIAQPFSFRFDGPASIR